MSERDGYIPGVPCWVDTTQADPAKAAEFYSRLFGWQLEDSMPEGAPPVVAWNTYIWVDGADATAKQVVAAGGSVLADGAVKQALRADPWVMAGRVGVGSGHSA